MTRSLRNRNIATDQEMMAGGSRSMGAAVGTGAAAGAGVAAGTGVGIQPPTITMTMDQLRLMFHEFTKGDANLRKEPEQCNQGRHQHGENHRDFHFEVERSRHEEQSRPRQDREDSRADNEDECQGSMAHRLRREDSIGSKAGAGAKKEGDLEVKDTRSTFQKRGTPFSNEIMAESVRGDFQTPLLPKYEGKGDPRDHVSDFEATMQLYNLSDALNCRVFVTTLTGRAQTWFTQLTNESIRTYDQLIDKFETYFASNKKMTKSAAHLYQIKQKDGESLRKFMTRFNDEKLSVPNLTIDMIINILIQGLKPGRFLSSLAMDPPKDMEALMKESDRCMNEEEVTKMKQDEQRNARREERRPIRERLGAAGARRISPPRYNKYRPLNVSMTTVLKEIRDKFDLNYPEKMKPSPKRLSSGKYCRFHKDLGHDTDECWQLCAEIERLINEGYLAEFLGNQRNQRFDPRPSNRRSQSPPRRRPRTPSPRRGDDRRIPDRRREPEKRGVIHTIAGGSSGGDTSNSRKRAMRVFDQRSRHQDTGIHTIAGDTRTNISFGAQDFEGLVLPHSDPLVITMDVAYYDVRRVLVDSGSSADILFVSTYDQLGLQRSKLQPVRTPLQGFGGSTVEPLGSIDLQTMLGTGRKKRIETITYLVVDAPFAYNAILGRPALNKFEAIISTLHLKIKFPTLEGVGEVRGDQKQ